MVTMPRPWVWTLGMDTMMLYFSNTNKLTLYMCLILTTSYPETLQNNFVFTSDQYKIMSCAPEITQY